MKSFYRFFALIFVVSITAVPTAHAIEFFREVEYPVSQVFVPDGFDDNDSVQFVIHGSFPNSCYQLGIVSTEFDNDTNKIFVRLTSYEYRGKCSDYPSPFHEVVHVGLLGRAGSFGIYDRKTGAYLGALKIEKAKHPGVGTDQAIYAPAQDAFFNQTPDRNELVIRGDFPWSCLKIGQVRVLVQHDVVVVLPEVTRANDEKCVVEHTPFEHRMVVKEPLPRGEFLLHVRTNGGQSINKMVHRLY